MEASDRNRQWRDPSAYAALLTAEPPMLAWEWLRRDRTYARAACAALAQEDVPIHGSAWPPSLCHDAAAPWGLHRFENPALTALQARPMWHALSGVPVLQATATAFAGEDCFDLRDLRHLATVLSGWSGEHLLFSDGVRLLRVDILAGSLGRGPVRLDYRLHGRAAAARSMRVLQQWLSAWTRRRLLASLHPPASRAAQRILELRVADALRAGASQREIAAELFDRHAGLPRWRAEDPSLRLRVQRLVRAGRRREAGAFRDLLRT